MANTHDDLRDIALAEFASAGYMGTSLQRIAELAGLSKSSVLYHYASKEALLDAALTPAVDAVGAVLARTASAVESADSRASFIADFVDCMLQYRLEIHIFINQSRALVDVPVMAKATDLVDGIAEYFHTQNLPFEQKMRFGIALGGAAYTLASDPQISTLDTVPVEEVRAALIAIVSELLSTIPTSPAEQ